MGKNHFGHMSKSTAQQSWQFLTEDLEGVALFLWLGGSPQSVVSVIVARRHQLSQMLLHCFRAAFPMHHLRRCPSA